MIVFAFDTETSGLIDTHLLPLDRQPEVIEFYGCLVDLGTGEVLHVVEHLIKPSRPVSEEITRITGIDNEMLKDQQPFAAYADEILAALEAAPVVAAHNLSYDMEVVLFEFERLGRKIQWPRLLCTVEATIHLKGHRLRLMDLHQLLFGEPFPEAHRARNDVMAMVKCMAELHKLGEI